MEACNGAGDPPSSATRCPAWISRWGLSPLELWVGPCRGCPGSVLWRGALEPRVKGEERSIGCSTSRQSHSLSGSGALCGAPLTQCTSSTSLLPCLGAAGAPWGGEGLFPCLCEVRAPPTLSSCAGLCMVGGAALLPSPPPPGCALRPTFFTGKPGLTRRGPVTCFSFSLASWILPRPLFVGSSCPCLQLCPFVIVITPPPPLLWRWCVRVTCLPLESGLRSTWLRTVSSDWHGNGRRGASPWP